MKTLRIIIISFCFLFLGTENLRAQQGSFEIEGFEAKGAGGPISYSNANIDYVVNAKGGGREINGLMNQNYEVLVVTGSGEMGINLAPSVYPNPSNGFVILSLECSKEDDLSYQIYDLNGEQLIHKKLACSETIISVAELPNAIYFMKVLNKDEAVKLFKIVKKTKRL